MTEAAATVDRFVRRVLWRTHWLALQDALAVALLVGGVVCAAITFYVRAQAGRLSWWMIVLACSIAAAVLLAGLLRTRSTRHEAALLIDRIVDLEDRIATARAILDSGGPRRLVEQAVIEDAAQRLASSKPSSVVPYRVRRWYALSALGVVALVAAVALPARSLPGREVAAEATAEIQKAGQHLEQSASSVEQIAPEGTETASLAREQAELGATLQRSTYSREQALSKLSALEDRIRLRHDELASTRADEIVNLAERRLRSALSKAMSKAKSATDQIEPSKPVASATVDQGRSVRASAGDASKQAPAPSDAVSAKKADAPEETKGDPELPSGEKQKVAEATEGKTGDDAKQPEPGPSESEKGPTTPASTRANSPGGQREQGRQSTEDETRTDKPTASESAGAQGEQEQGKQQPQQDKVKLQLPSALTGALAEQAAKALPSLAEELLKKAEQLRANELKPEDLKQLQQAAELLSRDLARIAQSKEFQKAVEQLARQVSPEQLEQLGKQLAGQEKLRQEMEAAARLLMQNQEVKQMVAGLAEKFGQIRDQMAPQARARGGRGERRGEGDASIEADKEREALATRKREERLRGALPRGSGGEYLPTQVRPGTGSARAAYSSAYPQYRRQAERSIDRSRVPLRMRSVVRDYFDAINPDAKPKP